MTAPPSQLDYAPPPPWHRRRRFRRAIYLIALLSFAATALYWGSPAWRHAQLLYWQRQCMTYTPPENHVIYEADPEKAAALLNANTGYAPAVFDPAIATYRPRPWTRFYNLNSPPGNLTDGTAFLHAMRTPSGNRRLVAIDVAPPLPPGGFRSSQGPPALQVRVFRPATSVSAPVEIHNTRRSPWGGWEVRRIRAGRIDPQDPSHFTLEVELLLDDARFTVDGWLRDDDSVVLQLRPPEN